MSTANSLNLVDHSATSGIHADELASEPWSSTTGGEAKVIRALVAAIDNAEAPPIHAGQTAPVHHHFHSGSAEVERLLLSRSDVRRVLLAEIHERERSAAELERLGMMDRAEALRAEALLAKRYMDAEFR